MLQCLRAHATFAEDQSRVLVPATTQGDFSTACHSSSRGSDTHLKPPMLFHLCAHIYT